MEKNKIKTDSYNNRVKKYRWFAKFGAIILTIMWLEQIIFAGFLKVMREYPNNFSIAGGIGASIGVGLVWFIPYGIPAIALWYYGFGRVK